VKLYGAERPTEAQFSPTLLAKAPIGNPAPAQISTSFAERQNLSMRMGLRRYTRLTSAFSRKIESHAAAVALYYFSFNFQKILRSR